MRGGSLKWPALTPPPRWRVWGRSAGGGGAAQRSRAGRSRRSQWPEGSDAQPSQTAHPRHGQVRSGGGGDSFTSAFWHILYRNVGGSNRLLSDRSIHITKEISLQKKPQFTCLYAFFKNATDSYKVWSVKGPCIGSHVLMFVKNIKLICFSLSDHSKFILRYFGHPSSWRIFLSNRGIFSFHVSCYF